jgi:hypothetical protein
MYVEWKHWDTIGAICLGAIFLLTIRGVQERVNAIAVESLSFLKALRQLYPTKTHQNTFMDIRTR